MESSEVAVQARDAGSPTAAPACTGAPAAEDALRGRQLDDAPAVHHRDALADLAHQPQVVRDEEVREAQPLLQIEQQIHDLRLHRDVERRDRLVADDERRLERERAREADALPLAAAELVRILRRRRRDRARPARTAAAPAPAVHRGSRAVDDERLFDDGADPHARVERRVRILEDDLKMPPRAAKVGRSRARARPCP